ncbi:adenylate/guanylate cyclase with GAF sensor(s) [Leptospira ryugenii]|uniref:Adenylate/guanylate cyclase with GAF sensor(S) n=1 Tax=Leptospira ryugenii TaxID=1917863 RepID=A0A2P2E0F2_9LEPT|nr:adenylate/guanylate cyclase domain-containing protein [Leptospira ryugenii]GBF50364.1 adenylate/guanylate cyclase with GAF sensor(s) [Leptospira ryugenii]
MDRNAIPANEDARMRALAAYDILDSEKEELFDDLTRLAAEICGTPISLITLVDKDRVWLKSKVGIDASEMPREGAFCSQAILSDTGIVISDVLADPKYREHANEGQVGVQFYAGTPLKTRDGFNIGTLCVIDTKPREMSEERLNQVRMLARQAMAQIELRHNLDALAKSTRKAVSLENLIKRYTSKSVWERADVTVEKGHLDLHDEEVQATYFFLDAVGFTKLSEQLGSAATVELLNTYFKPVVDRIFANRGDIDKFVGDQIFCLFPDPNDALRAAIEIRELVERLNKERKEMGLVALEFTMGLNVGASIRANVGGEDRRDNTLIGNAVNIAARLQKACRPGSILISDSLLRLVDRTVHSVQAVKLKLKNVSEILLAHYVEVGPR